MQKLLSLSILLLLFLTACKENTESDLTSDKLILGKWDYFLKVEYYDAANNKVFEERYNDSTLYNFTRNRLTISYPNSENTSATYSTFSTDDKKYILVESSIASQSEIIYLTRTNMEWRMARQPDSYLENGTRKNAAKAVYIEVFTKK
ncbi:hypothetical protein HUW51_07835 [Adhaeribacter swui]|uniref:Lipocalin family protein n=1 Tax=Adhaeribacter swui TaxID=2086471 RepID=A0A7G7G658_9BACT|nr:hypothetical protein [Adhaeribacter swui]QNF32642.1 hypothetical protein HUW51_07835 [Adhaeribacter swui]